MEKVSVIIPNWNGRKLLEKNLPHLLKALDFSSQDNEIIVVDDGSTDESVDFLRTNYPTIKLIASKNQGFGRACNLGVKEAKNDIALLLNNDAQVMVDFLYPLLKHFQNEDIFAVASNDDYPSKYGNLCCQVTKFSWGFFGYRHLTVREESLIGKAVPVLYPYGACAAFDRKKFLALGGFDPLFRPFYVEDLDLAFRAWKQGWKSLYENESRYYHQGGASIKRKHSPFFVKSILWKNRFLFIWKNITTRKLFIQHLIFLPLLVLGAPFLGKIHFSLGFFLALGQMKEALKKREKGKEKFTDLEIIKMFQEGYWKRI